MTRDIQKKIYQLKDQTLKNFIIDFLNILEESHSYSRPTGASGGPVRPFSSVLGECRNRKIKLRYRELVGIA